MRVLIQFASLILFVLVTCVPSSSLPKENTKTPLKVASFPYPGYDTLTAYLDVFAITHLQDPATRAAVVVYGSGTGLPGVDSRRLREVRNYLVMYKDVAPERLVLLVGGLSCDPRIELWVLPPGADVPKPVTEGLTDTRDYSTTYKYDELYLLDETSELVPPALANEMGMLDGFAVTLKKESASRGVIIAHPKRTRHRMDSPTQTQAMLDERVAYLVRVHGIARARISVRVGRARQDRSLELWIDPRPGAKPPRSPQ